ncbi:MAG: hypothetical protein AMXMBFR37_07980 [Steroidobacteraceae bacterium]
MGRAVELFDVGGEPGALLAELLRAFGIGPGGGIFQLAVYFLEPFGLGVVLKETPVTNARAPRGPGACASAD